MTLHSVLGLRRFKMSLWPMCVWPHRSPNWPRPRLKVDAKTFKDSSLCWEWSKTCALPWLACLIRFITWYYPLPWFLCAVWVPSMRWNALYALVGNNGPGIIDSIYVWLIWDIIESRHHFMIKQSLSDTYSAVCRAIGQNNWNNEIHHGHFRWTSKNSLSDSWIIYFYP